MKCVNFYRKPISVFVMVTFIILLCYWANQAPAAPVAGKNSQTALEQRKSGTTDFFEQEGEKESTVAKSKKFPWLLVAGGVVVVAGLILLIGKKKDNTTYVLADLAGTWKGTAGSFDLNLNVDSTGKVTGIGVSSTWSIDNTGKVTGGGSFGCIIGSHYIVAAATWNLQLDTSKNQLSGTLYGAHPDIRTKTVSLSKQ